MPPQSVTASVINATSARIRWEPPPANTWNGELTGYLVSFRLAPTKTLNTAVREKLQNVFWGSIKAFVIYFSF